MRTLPIIVSALPGEIPDSPEQDYSHYSYCFLVLRLWPKASKQNIGFNLDERRACGEKSHALTLSPGFLFYFC
jgi:hypothetical protein